MHIDLTGWQLLTGGLGMLLGWSVGAFLWGYVKETISIRRRERGG